MTPDPSALVHPYTRLVPDVVLDAIEHTGLRCDGRLIALNSYENRVYQVWLEDGSMVVAKFYRPQRWRDEAIAEEHTFAAELVERELPVVAPLTLQGRTLHQYDAFRFAVFPRRGGRTPEFDHADTLEWMGRFLGRMHAVGGLHRFVHRPTLDIASFGDASRDYLLAHDCVPPELRTVWHSVADAALEGVRQCYARAGDVATLRLHGDCHAGNVLWSDDGPHFVDLDDSRMGPAVQDLWMMLSGDRAAMTRQLADILAGYEDFMDFDQRELHLIEALRTLRLLHYSAWLARRWQDPAFPAAFPWFNTVRYWEERILELREQCAVMQEPPLWST